MTLGSKGMKLSPDPHRRRMPWTAAKECVPGVVLDAKEKMVLDGVQLVDVECVDRASQVDPLEALRATVAVYEYNTSTGKNIFQLASQVEFDGCGQRFYRKEWQEETYDEYITLSAIDFNRDGDKGAAHGYVTFHGETTTRPVQIDFADVPVWHVEFRVARAVSFNAIVPPPPSIGTDVPVDARSYRLRAYPWIDATDIPSPMLVLLA
ncbi:hypothetical protein MOQ_007562 [Trypanosoma cruzi marinkellei]|uniref:Uncharacterized protein n=1 Tax=Trypanosoma cruzi marinkellei TaxID=85056 RepID=K2M174_TRYCR|nr:hypothetical protein MOQ_007562 [Trypanosoma cruzi marinkellei]